MCNNAERGIAKYISMHLKSEKNYYQICKFIANILTEYFSIFSDRIVSHLAVYVTEAIYITIVTNM